MEIPRMGSEGTMCFQKVIAIINAVMPLITVIIAGVFCPTLLDKWHSCKIRCCYNSLISCFDKFCRNLGCRCLLRTFQEDYFDKDSDIESLVNNAKNTPFSSINQGWKNLSSYHQFKTALNNARTKAGLEARNFFSSRHFVNEKYGELLAVLIVNKNTAEIKAFCRGDWELPKRRIKLQQRLHRCKIMHRIKIKLFGYDRPDYSIMLV